MLQLRECDFDGILIRSKTVPMLKSETVSLLSSWRKLSSAD